MIDGSELPNASWSFDSGSRDGAAVRALASHQCVSGSIIIIIAIVIAIIIIFLILTKLSGITSLFRLHINAVKDCTPVSLNCALVRLNISPVSLDITQVSLNNAPVTLFTVRFQRWR